MMGTVNHAWRITEFTLTFCLYHISDVFACYGIWRALDKSNRGKTRSWVSCTWIDCRWTVDTALCINCCIFIYAYKHWHKWARKITRLQASYRNFADAAMYDATADESLQANKIPNGWKVKKLLLTLFSSWQYEVEQSLACWTRVGYILCACSPGTCVACTSRHRCSCNPLIRLLDRGIRCFWFISITLCNFEVTDVSIWVVFTRTAVRRTIHWRVYCPSLRTSIRAWRRRVLDSRMCSS